MGFYFLSGTITEVYMKAGSGNEGQVKGKLGVIYFPSFLNCDPPTNMSQMALIRNLLKLMLILFKSRIS